MNYYELDNEEQKLLEAVGKGQFQSVKDLASARDKLTAIARQAGNKTRNINIRVSERLLRKLKVKATEDGIPYQTLAASILHRNVNKQS